jgi:hypothetical protein
VTGSRCSEGGTNLFLTLLRAASSYYLVGNFCLSICLVTLPAGQLVGPGYGSRIRGGGRVRGIHACCKGLDLVFYHRQAGEGKGARIFVSAVLLQLVSTSLRRLWVRSTNDWLNTDDLVDLDSVYGGTSWIVCEGSSLITYCVAGC